jgi:hypothetical protein
MVPGSQEEEAATQGRARVTRCRPSLRSGVRPQAPAVRAATASAAPSDHGARGDAGAAVSTKGPLGTCRSSADPSANFDAGIPNRNSGLPVFSYRQSSAANHRRPRRRRWWCRGGS